MSRKTWTTGQKGLLILYLSQNTHFCLPFSILSCLFSKTKYKSMFVYFSAERGAPSKHAHNATTITKLKNSKCQNIFRCIFDDFFFRILQWIPEEFFDVFTNFFELLLPTKMSFSKRFHFHEFFIFYFFFFLFLISGGSRVRKISVISKI